MAGVRFDGGMGTAGVASVGQAMGNRASRRAVLVGGLGVALGLAAVEPAKTRGRRKPRPKPCEQSTDDAALRLLDLVNAHRAAHGRRALVLDAILGAAARDKAAAMAAAGRLSHTIDGIEFDENLTRHGYPARLAWVGENIARGDATADDVFAAWRSSPDHNANLLHPEFRAMGIGLTLTGEDEFGAYWAQTFGSVVVTKASGCATG